jgi:hypothetical protein
LNGGNDEDILVGAVHDNDLVALDVIMAIWRSAATFDSRVVTRSGAGGLLRAGETVFDDNDRDTMNGGTGRDLVFGETSLLDDVMDLITLQSSLDTLVAVI